MTKYATTVYYNIGYTQTNTTTIFKTTSIKINHADIATSKSKLSRTRNVSFSFQPVGFVTFHTRAGAEAAKQDLQVNLRYCHIIALYNYRRRYNSVRLGKKKKKKKIPIITLYTAIYRATHVCVKYLGAPESSTLARCMNKKKKRTKDNRLFSVSCSTRER